MVKQTVDILNFDISLLFPMMWLTRRSRCLYVRSSDKKEVYILAARATLCYAAHKYPGCGWSRLALTQTVS